MRPRLSGLPALVCVLLAALPLSAQRIAVRDSVLLVLPPSLTAPALTGLTASRLPGASPFRDVALADLLPHRPFAEWVAAPGEPKDSGPRRLLLEARLARAADHSSAVHASPNGPGNVTIATSDGPAGLFGEHADLGLVVTGTGNMGGSWTRYKPCDTGVQFNCDPNLFPQLKPEVQFGVRMGGTISDRVHVDVDYDQAREFDAANNINVYYQGLPDEVLQRVEVGDVSIRLPSSRYMTRGVPAGNFGVMAAGRVGGLEVQTLFAQQRGDVNTREFRIGGGGQAGVEQDAELVVDDADYVRGQFFFMVPPQSLAGYPHIDAPGLRGTAAPAAVRPAVGGSILVYRDEPLAHTAGAQEAQLGQFLADAVPAGGGPRHTGSFRRLQQDQDYIIHASGLWLMLRSPLRPDEALAVAFVTESGDTVGALNAENAPAGVTPVLRLLRGPTSTHQPGSATWPMEMHQVYRLDSSSDVDVASIDLRISLGGAAGGRTFRDVAGRQLSLLRFFGLDEDSPADRIDAAQVYQPARDVFAGAGTPIGGTYIMFPTLRPFLEPAPLRSERLSAAELQAALGSDANSVIYEDPDPVTREGATRFRLNFEYRVRIDGLATSFNLGAFGIREGSERVHLGDRLLLRDVDYSIDYEIGTVMLLDAQSLFATTTDGEIRATWEQKPLFTVAPTAVFGASARYGLGTRGELNFIGLHQAEKSIMTRPQLGAEPGAAFVGGASGRFELGGALLDRMLGAVPGLRNGGTSSIGVTGEMAFSAPNPNRRDVAYLDDFEGSDEVPLSVRKQDWRLGSAPQSTEGDAGRLPIAVDATTAAPLVWQHDFFQDGGVRGALTPSTQIDRRLNVVGREMQEPVMWLTYGGPGSPPATSHWRSITTVLSTTGRDMTRSEFLEFYVDARGAQPLALIFDIGTVGEDAMFVDSLGRTSGVREDGRAWGIGVLDEEARLIDREVWGAERDRRGLWDQTCEAEPGVTYPLGDPRANCTRNNGLSDTEDLNGNGVLDADDGQYFRYVVELDRMSEYLVRDTAATGTTFRLYRIPLRSGTAVNGANDGTWRFIRHLRMTVAGEATTSRSLTVARLRIIGSRWTKRDVHGVQRGLLDAEPGFGGTGTLRVGPVSRVTDGTHYIEPPGVLEEAQDLSTQYGTGGFEINEKSLRLAYDGLGADERVEVYYRYPQQPRNMLMYRELRLWAMAREGDWGPGGTQRLTVRVGTDPRNFYMYQTRLSPATGARPAATADWLPELVIDVEQWLELKARAERQLIERGTAIGTDTLWSADSTYALVLEDRARAPNLAAVRELVFAVYNGGTAPATGEVWIDELRVGRPDREPGAAGNVNVDVIAGDVGAASISFANQGSLFRQIGETPHYLGGRELNARADARLDRLLPESWALALPVTVSHHRSAQAPMFLQQSDVLADRLDGLRDAGADATRVGIRISRTEPLANPWLGLLVDGSALRLSYNTGSDRTVVSRAESSGFIGELSYRRELAHRDLGTIPEFIGRALRGVAPARVEQSDAFTRLLASRLRWSPASLSFGSTYSDQLTRSYLYDRILSLPGDTAVVPIESPRQALRSDAQLGLQPFERLTASLSVTSDRDLLDAGRAARGNAERRALERARASVGGMDVGWESARMMNSSLAYRPQITEWLSAGYTFGNRFIMDRNAGYLEFDTSGSGTTASLHRRFESTRSVARTLLVQPMRMAAAVGADTTGLLEHWQRIDISWRSMLSSQFEREPFMPSAGYQLGIGGFDAFTYMAGDTAARAQQRETFTAATALRLIGDAVLNVSYTAEDIENFDARGGSRTQQRIGWPHMTVQWNRVAVPPLLDRVVASWGGSLGVQRNEAFTRYDTEQADGRGTTELRFPVSLNVGFMHGITLNYRGAFSAGEVLDPTGNVESGGHQQDISMNAVIQPPDRWRGKLDGPITARLSFAEQQQQQCRYNPSIAAADGCIAFLDLGTRNANFTIESILSDITVGMLVNYIARQSQVGTRTGSRQFQVGLYGRFSFEAGRMPGGL